MGQVKNILFYCNIDLYAECSTWIHTVSPVLLFCTGCKLTKYTGLSIYQKFCRQCTLKNKCNIFKHISQGSLSFRLRHGTMWNRLWIHYFITNNIVSCAACSSQCMQIIQYCTGCKQIVAKYTGLSICQRSCRKCTLKNKYNIFKHISLGSL